MEVYRVYYWIKGAPADRPGGPWWYRDVHGDQALEALVGSLLPVCQEIRVTPISPRKAREKADPWAIRPPRKALLVRANPATRRGWSLVPLESSRN